MPDTVTRRRQGRNPLRPPKALVCALLASLLSGCDTTSLPDWDWLPWSDSRAEGEAAGSTDQDRSAGPGARQQADEAFRPSPEAVAAVQERLAELGYAPGPIDGLMGPRTRGAIRRYQADAGLPTDGRISRDLMSLLEATVPPASASGEPSRITAGPPPEYEAGSRFVYVGGEVEVVVDVTGPMVHWRSNGGASFTTYQSFVAPPLSWQAGQEVGRRNLSAKPSDLWPLKPGEEVSFIASTRVRYGERPDNVSTTRETWRCRLEGRERITVRAGTFDTRKIACERHLTPPGPSLRRVWHYAPAIRHYVLREDVGEASEAPRRLELLAIQPGGGAWPPAARAGLGWALEHALETAAAGHPTVWNSSAVDTEVTIEAGAYVEGGAGETCRSFRQVWTGGSGRRVYPGVACRDGSGRWLVPGLEPGVAVATDMSRIDSASSPN